MGTKTTLKAARASVFERVMALLAPAFYREIAAEYGATVIDLGVLGEDVAMLLGKNQGLAILPLGRIVLGAHDSKAEQDATFFHEMGHVIDVRSGKVTGPAWSAAEHYANELSAWRTGLRLARKKGITFSNAALANCDKHLMSYVRGPMLEKKKPRSDILRREFGRKRKK
jgi:hypothetical protein